MVTDGTFREDLYFRLNGITIEVPPLRERREQISTIANELLAKACIDAKRPPMQLTKEAIARLESYDWPGNVRELKNAIERAVLLSQGEQLDVMALPAGDAGDEAAGARLRNDLAAFRASADRRSARKVRRKSDESGAASRDLTPHVGLAPRGVQPPTSARRRRPALTRSLTHRWLRPATCIELASR